MIRFLLVAVCISILMPNTAAAYNGDNPAKVLMENIFSEVEKAIIKEYFDKPESKNSHKHKAKNNGKGKPKGLPPGLTKKDTLPPGLAKHVEKHGTLPAGLQKRELPNDLLSRLPKLKNGKKRVIVGSDILLIEEGTELILDIIRDIF